MRMINTNIAWLLMLLPIGFVAGPLSNVTSLNEDINILTVTCKDALGAFNGTLSVFAPLYDINYDGTYVHPVCSIDTDPSMRRITAPPKIQLITLIRGLLSEGNNISEQ